MRLLSLNCLTAIVYNGITLYKSTELCTELFSFRPNVTSKFRRSPYLKDSSNNIMIQMELLGVSMIFHCIKLHLSKCNELSICN
jgi:hypothetical protein